MYMPVPFRLIFSCIRFPRNSSLIILPDCCNPSFHVIADGEGCWQYLNGERPSPCFQTPPNPSCMMKHTVHSQFSLEHPPCKGVLPQCGTSTFPLHAVSNPKWHGRVWAAAMRCAGREAGVDAMRVFKYLPLDV